MRAKLLTFILLTLLLPTTAIAATMEIIPPKLDYKKLCSTQKQLELSQRKSLELSLDEAGDDINLQSAKDLLSQARSYLQQKHHYDRLREIVFYLVRTEGPFQNDARYLLGRMYVEGAGVPQDTEKAKKYLLEAYNNGNVQAAYQLGVLFEQEQNYEQALAWYKAAVANNLPAPLYRIAMLYIENHLPASEEEKQRIYTFTQNNLLETISTGECTYLRTIADIFNKSTSLSNRKELYALWMDAASQADDPHAKIKMAELYFYGIGVKANPQKAVQLWKEAVDLGDRRAMYLLGKAYVEGTLIKVDQTRGLRLLARSADLGYGPATKWRISNEILDPKEQHRLLKLATEDETNVDNAELFYRLGLSYENGVGTPIDAEKAFEAYKAAANLSHPKALIKVGDAYRYGLGVERKKMHGLRYYRQAFHQGSTDAAEIMQETYICGIEKETDQEKAGYWQERAFFAGNTTMLLDQSLVAYEEGDKQRAFDLLHQAAKRDSRKALAWLSILFADDRPDDAKNWKRLATLPGEKQSDGYFVLGDAALYGRYRPVDIDEGLRLLEKASNMNDMAAKLRLASWYMEQQQPNKAEDYLTYPASTNYRDSIKLLAQFYISQKRYAEAIKWLQRDISMNHSYDAALLVASAYDKGGWAETDVQKANSWFRKALSLYPCSVSSLLDVAQAYEEGKYGVEKNSKTAQEWVDKASLLASATYEDQYEIAKNVVDAGYNLGSMSVNEALSILEEAAQKGNSDVAYDLAMIHLMGRPNIAADAKHAAELLELAASRNHSKAMFQLGNLYLSGLGVKPSVEKARELFVKAAELGNFDAKERLKFMK